jgi:hypothetical protein
MSVLVSGIVTDSVAVSVVCEHAVRRIVKISINREYLFIIKKLPFLVKLMIALKILFPF